MVTIVIHEITCRQRTGSAAREMSLSGQLRHSCVRAEDQRPARPGENGEGLRDPFVEGAPLQSRNTTPRRELFTFKAPL